MAFRKNQAIEMIFLVLLCGLVLLLAGPGLALDLDTACQFNSAFQRVCKVANVDSDGQAIPWPVGGFPNDSLVRPLDTLGTLSLTDSSAPVQPAGMYTCSTVSCTQERVLAATLHASAGFHRRFHALLLHCGHTMHIANKHIVNAQVPASPSRACTW